MRFTDIFIKRPVLAICISLLIFILGLKSLFDMDVRQFPKVENTVITVTTSYPGASGVVVQGFITQPIESAISSADGIDYLSSSSTQGLSTIQAHLRLNFNAATAFSDILAKVNSVKNQLPRDAFDPVLVKSTGDSFASMYINYSSNKLSNSQIYDYLSRVIQPKLQSVPGVAQAQLLGGNPFAVRIWLNQERMASRKVTASDLVQAVNASSFISAAGQLKGQYVLINLDAKTDLHTAKEFADIIVSRDGTNIIRLKDVADVELGSQNYSSSVTFNGSKGVFIGIQALPNANPLTVIKNVRAILPNIAKDLPPAVIQSIVFDATTFISASITDVIKTLVEAALIVMVVIFLFLGSLRAVIIPVVTIPLSLVGVCFLMQMLGYSINLLTLLAMVLAIGLVVDDAIVVVENVTRHIEEGSNPLKAAVEGAREIALPVISMTITLAAVYAPIGLMGGLTGALFKEFALTLAASVFVSGIVALTLSPMMCSKILKHTPLTTKTFAHWLDERFVRLQNYYEKKLHEVLNFRPVVVTAGIVILISVFFLFKFTPTELAPHDDQGILFAFTQAPNYANINYLEKYTSEINEKTKNFPEVSDVFIVNNMGGGGESSGFAGVRLKDWGERNRSAMKIQPLMQQKFNNIAGIRATLFPPPDLPTGGSGLPIQFVITTTSGYSELYKYSQQILAKAKASGLFIVINNDLDFDSPEYVININRDKASELGVSMQDIGTTLSTLLGGNYISLFSIEGRSYQVIPQLRNINRANPSDLAKAYVRTSSGILVPLSNLISFTSASIPPNLNRFQQLNAATLSAVMMPTQTSGTGLSFLIKTAHEILPSGYSYDYSGDARTQMKEGNALVFAFLFALIMIFLVLAAQFESFRDPLAILVSVPMAICGALIPLNLGLASINIYTEVGLVTLIGLISKHGILMVEFANHLRENQGYDLRKAIEKAASVRLRPILMTTGAMVFGVIPMILASGAGSAARFNIGLVIACGLLVGTCFTLFIVPTMYTLITSKKKDSIKIE